MRRHTTCTLLCDALQHRTVRQSTLLTMYLCTYTLRERYSLGNTPVLVTLLASLVIVAYFLRFVNAFLESCKKLFCGCPLSLIAAAIYLSMLCMRQVTYATQLACTHATRHTLVHLCAVSFVTKPCRNQTIVALSSNYRPSFGARYT